ncbi:MAG: hypothetical protein SH856_04005 [Flavobacteriales bacterium]|nr:hypothetical protein [Flavobacteriales bacterium]
MYGRKSSIYSVGQQLHVTRSEWRWKHNPLQRLVNRVAKKTGHRFTTYNVLGRGGWIVKREE